MCGAPDVTGTRYITGGRRLVFVSLHEVVNTVPRLTEVKVADWIEALKRDGYSVVRGLFAPEEVAGLRVVAEAVRHQAVGRHFTERMGNVRFFSDGDSSRPDQLRSVIWCGLLSPQLEAVRRDPRLFELLEPLLGATIRQVTNQLHYKPPGADASFPLHTDRSSRLRDQGDQIRNLDSCFIQTGIAIDAMSGENGGVYYVPGSHHWSATSVHAQPASRRRRPEEDYEATMPEDCVPVCLEPGDVVVWTGDTVHGSAVNSSKERSRTLYINGYVRGRDCLRGYWAWIKGTPVPLPPIDVPALVYGEPGFEPFDASGATELVERVMAHSRGGGWSAQAD